MIVYVQVNDNGVISFYSRYNPRTSSPLPLYGSYRIIAPYWADVDTRGSGKIYYRQTSDPNLLDRATSEIRQKFSMSENITVTNLLIATWNNVGYYNQNSDKVCMYTHKCTDLFNIVSRDYFLLKLKLINKYFYLLIQVKQHVTRIGFLIINKYLRYSVKFLSFDLTATYASE